MINTVHISKAGMMAHRAWLAAMTLLICTTYVWAGGERVRDRGRFEVEAKCDEGPCILKPETLAALPTCSARAASPYEPTPCQLVEIGALGGSQWFWYQENSIVNHQPRVMGQLIEVKGQRDILMVWGLAGEEGIFIEKAAVLRKPQGTFFHICVGYTGTGAMREDVLLQWKGAYWQEIDTTSWSKVITLPPCYGLWKGPFLDFESLSLDMSVWINGDGNCCPTGGRLKVKFKIEGDVLKVAEWRHVRSKDDGTPWDSGRRIDVSKCGPRSN
jgi:hypothetical protein